MSEPINEPMVKIGYDAQTREPMIHINHRILYDVETAMKLSSELADSITQLIDEHGDWKVWYARRGKGV